MGQVSDSISSIAQRITENHFILFPYVFLSFFGNGFLFILFYYDLDASLLMETLSIETILLLSIVLSIAIYFIYNLMTLLELISKRESLRSDLLAMTWLTNYYYLLAIFTAKFFPLKAGFLSSFILITLAILGFTLVRTILQTVRKKKTDNSPKYKNLLEVEEIIKDFIEKRFGEEAELIKIGRKVDVGKYENIAKFKNKKIRILQNADNRIIEWEFLQD